MTERGESRSELEEAISDRLEETLQNMQNLSYVPLLFTVARIVYDEDGDQEKFYRAKYQLEEVRTLIATTLRKTDEELELFKKHVFKPKKGEEK